MKKFLYWYTLLFVSACNFSKLVKARGEPYEIAFWWISFLIGVNLASLLMLIKYFVDFDIGISKIAFILVFFIPPFIFNYFAFLRNKNYKKLLDEIKTYAKGFIFYMLMTVLLFIVTGYINIP